MNKLLNNPVFVESQKKQHEKTQALLKALGKIKHDDIKTQAVTPTVYVYPDFWKKIPFERVEKSDAAAIKICFKEIMIYLLNGDQKTKVMSFAIHLVSQLRMPTDLEELVIDVDTMSTKFELREDVITIPAMTTITHKTPIIGWQSDLLKSIDDMSEHNCLIIGPFLGCLITRLDRKNHEAVARKILLLPSS